MPDYDRMKEVCRDIAADAEADVRELEGRAATPRTVSEMFGKQGAAIQALAKVQLALLEAREEAS